MPAPAYLLALLMAKADDDADTLAELRDVLADPEHADALLGQAEGGDVDPPDEENHEPPVA